MKRLVIAVGAIIIAATSLPLNARRIEQRLTDGWEFKQGPTESAGSWKPVNVPHDWAICGPFSRDNDLQCVVVEQNGETEESWKTGRTGGLPFIGKGTYRRTLNIAADSTLTHTLIFDGAMSNARVSVNGRPAVTWPYGYSSFYTCIDSLIHPGENELTVELENLERQSRWYPGAGLYRNVHLRQTGRVHIPVWGTYITTPHVSRDYASVSIRLEIEGARSLDRHPYGEAVDVTTTIYSPEGKEVGSTHTRHIARSRELTQKFIVNNPQLWSPGSPALYSATTLVSVDGTLTDSCTTRFGIRKLEYIPEKGFFLNGEPTKFKGVCNHHDLGPLGAAVNESALRHQVRLLKEMGANAIRTAHNMPAPELVRVCDEMGMMLMLEPFDDWGFRPKSANGYGILFDEWAGRDVTNMVRQYRSSPSVVMWSIGNEVPSQWGAPGIGELEMLQELVHRLDPTRPVTCGMDQINSVLTNGYAAALDIPGFNYKPQYYRMALDLLPQKLVLGTETASTVASRGQYKFPATPRAMATYPDHQSSAYATEYCSWSNVPDIDFAADDDIAPLLGQFVWTGFDYLGEPSPYDTDAWPSHSSMFGIFDLASLPKDSYWLYRSQWRTDSPTLHVLPHWTWPGREGETTPVMAFTSYPEAELFVNGVSKGRRSKNRDIAACDVRTAADGSHIYTATDRADDASALMQRYRLIWPDVVYEPGEITVVAYDNDGNRAAEQTVRTAGKPYRLLLSANTNTLTANGEDLAYITIKVADKEGNIVPTDTRRVKFKVDGAATFEATANGDPTCTLPFQNPEMDLFAGAATAIVRAASTPGTMSITVSADGLRRATLTLPVRSGRR